MSNPTYSPGLEGVIAGESSICAVDPNAGLLYRGYDVDDLTGSVNFEQIVWLLLHGELPKRDEIEQIRSGLAASSPLPEPVVKMLWLVPPTMHPVDVLRTGVSMLAGFEPELDDRSHAANVRKAIRLIAHISSLTTSGERVARGLDPLPITDQMTYAERFLFNLLARRPEAWEVDAMNVVLVLYAEHEFNASTFAARVTVSTLSDIYAGVTSAIGTLKGALHGGANEAAMNVLREVATPANASRWIADRLAKHEKVMGFGHRVYRSGDSRVPKMRALCKELGDRRGEPQWHEICVALEDAMAKQKNMFANLDLYAAPVLHLLRIPPKLNTSVFACSRAAGWCAHVIEQHDHNRLIRPRCLYTGPAPRTI